MSDTTSVPTSPAGSKRLAALTAKQISYRVRTGLQKADHVIMDDPGYGAGFLAPLNEALESWNLEAEFCWDEKHKVRKLKVMHRKKPTYDHLIWIVLTFAAGGILLYMIYS